MNATKDIKPISYIKAHTAEILNQVNETHSPLYVTQNGEARAVIVDTKSYQALLDSITIMKLISQSEEDIAQGRFKTQEEVFEIMEQKLASIKESL